MVSSNHMLLQIGFLVMAGIQKALNALVLAVMKGNFFAFKAFPIHIKWRIGLSCSLIRTIHECSGFFLGGSKRGAEGLSFSQFLDQQKHVL